MRNLKRVLSLALALVMVLGMMVITTSAADFKDADEITYTEAMDIMVGLGVFQGDDNNNVNPTDVLTRKEAAVLIARIILGDRMAASLAPTKQLFDDVPLTADTEWYAAAVEYCNNIGMIVGHDGKFNPDGELTGTAFAKLLLCAMGYDADAQGYVGDNWDTNINADAMRNGLNIKGVKLTDKLTREGAAQMIFLALDADMVYYETSFDKATGAPVLTGPFVVKTEQTYYDFDYTNSYSDDTVQFTDEYFPYLKLADDYRDNWGRPVDHYWFYSNKSNVLYSEMMVPEVSYTEKVAECDIADALDLRVSTDVYRLTVNSVDVDPSELFGADKEFTLTSTRPSVGAQGQLVEVYNVGSYYKPKYEVVVIDTYLAKVTDVEVVEYDKNGHIDEYAELDLAIYTSFNDATNITLYAATDYEYSTNDMLLVNFDADGAYSALLKGNAPYAEVVDYADSIVGTQSAYVYNADSHIVEDVEYLDAAEFNLDEAGSDALNEHTWYFDQYGNLIGAADVRTSSTYATISSIYWQNSFGGERGYAKAVLTYMDGSQETVKVAAIKHFGDTTATTLSSANGDGVYADGKVSTTKQYNEAVYDAYGNVTSVDADYTNRALYVVVPGYYGATLVEVDSAAVEIETGVPTLATGVVAGQTTQFLVWDEYYEEYTTYTGIRNVPTYDGTVTAFYVNGRDDIADYVFVIDPTAIDEEDTATYYYNGGLSVKTYLYYTFEYYYVISGGYVNGEKASITTFDPAVVAAIEAAPNTLIKLGLRNGFVETVDNWADNETINVVTKDEVVYAGNLVGADLADGILTIDGQHYDVADAAIINAYRCSLNDLFEEIEDGDIKANEAFVYVIYTEGKVLNTTKKIASLIYVSTKAPVDFDKLATDAAEAALDAAKAEAVAELKAFINAEVQKADTTDKIAATADVTTDATTDISATGWGASYDRMVEVYTTWKGQLESKTTIADVEHHLNVLKAEFDRVDAAAKYVAQYLSDLATAAAKTATVKDATELAAALSDSAIETIKLSANITVTDTINLNGKNLDGAGYAISAPYKMDADSGKDAIKTTGGKISNVTIVGGWRGIEATTLSADLVLENVTILDSVRALHVEGGGTTKYALTATGCVFGGKLSWDNSRISAATFIDCSFKAPGVSFKKDVIDFYTATLFDGCDFESGFAFSFADLKKIGSFAEVKLVDCTVDGVATPDATYDLRTADFTFGA